jgi:hypothetical protein
MTPPIIPRALVAIATARADYESVSGDLHEEYVRLARSSGNVDADRWYWSQVLRSLPSLLSYSRSGRSVGSAFVKGLLVAGLTLAMLVCAEFLDDAIRTVYPYAGGVKSLPVLIAEWMLAAAFGVAISASVRSHGLRATLFASFGLVAAVAVPIVLGFSSPLPPIEWLLLLGAVPAMSAGAAAYQAVSRR